MHRLDSTLCGISAPPPAQYDPLGQWVAGQSAIGGSSRIVSGVRLGWTEPDEEGGRLSSIAFSARKTIGNSKKKKSSGKNKWKVTNVAF